FSAWFAVIAFVCTVACDLKDLERDRASGTRTLPLRWGRARTLAYLRRVNALATAIVVLAVVTGAFPPSGIGLAAVSLYLRRALGRLDRPDADVERVCDVAIDGFGLSLVPCLLATLACG